MSEADIKAAFSRTLEQSDIEQAEPPRPLRRPMTEAQLYPVECIGSSLETAAKAIHSKIQAPMAICAQSVLAAATLATQAHADVVLHTGQTRPASNFFFTIAESGERKTSVDEEALRGIRERETELRETHDEEQKVWRNEHDAWEQQRKQVLNNKKAYPDKQSKQRALDELGAKPPLPLRPSIVCQEPTYEGLCKQFGEGLPSLGVFAGEGGQFVGGHGMNPDNRLKTAAGLSHFWDGVPATRTRAGDGTSILVGKRLTLHLMMQSMVANQVLSDPMMVNQGLLSRILITAPISTAGTRTFRKATTQEEATIAAFGRKTLDLLHEPMPLVTGTRNQLTPRKLPLSSKAELLLISFSDYVEQELADGGQYQPVKGFASKLPEHAARIAATLTLFENIHAKAIAETDMAAAIQLAQYYAGEALRLFGSAHVAPDILLAEKVLRWLHDKWGEPFMSLPDLYQYGTSGVDDATTARRIVGILEQHGWLVRCSSSVTIKGSKRREAWLIVRAE